MYLADKFIFAICQLYENVRISTNILVTKLNDDNLRFYVLFSGISVISRWWVGDKERLCSMELRLWLQRIPPRAGLEPGTARSADQRLTYWATGAPSKGEGYIHDNRLDFGRAKAWSAISRSGLGLFGSLSIILTEIPLKMTVSIRSTNHVVMSKVHLWLGVYFFDTYFIFNIYSYSSAQI